MENRRNKASKRRVVSVHKSKMVQVYSDSVYEDADTITEYDDSIVIF